ncbi:MAG: hypothetical protein QF437_24700 [Planctomycetota bacterium]|nr:hypothetical protein [Planctomycetota bacterium]
MQTSHSYACTCLLLLASCAATLLAEKANGTDGRVLDTPIDRVLVYSNQTHMPAARRGKLRARTGLAT